MAPRVCVCVCATKLSLLNHDDVMITTTMNVSQTTDRSASVDDQRLHVHNQQGTEPR